MCTIGPSGPTASPLPHAHVTPTTLATSARHPNALGMCVPFNVAITSVTPPPAACGAQNSTSDDATTTRRRHDAAYA
eukprot:31412-Pelagococcus_subviridis.AAC.10